MSDTTKLKEIMSPADKVAQFKAHMGTLIEQTMVRDLLLLGLTKDNKYDRDIVMKLIEGKKLVRGELTHILDEVAQINLPDALAEFAQRLSAAAAASLPC